jgi:SAM-dependent methyltransferase
MESNLTLVLADNQAMRPAAKLGISIMNNLWSRPGHPCRSACRRIRVIADDRLISDRFPRASAYHPEWVLGGVSGGANPLWLTEWLCEGLDLRPGMRVLDLGCGRALSSIFLHREFDVQVWATDLWFSASENSQRVRDAGAHEGVFPISADARSLPFSEGFFDAVVSIDSFMFYGTDDLYLNYLARFVKPGGPVGIALAGFTNEVNESIPAHLSEWWANEMAHCLHSADWWRKHWQRSGVLDVAVADTLPDGWRFWRDWLKLVAPGNESEIRTLETDAGRYFGYVRAIGHRREEAKLFDPLLTVPVEYGMKPLLRMS